MKLNIGRVFCYSTNTHGTLQNVSNHRYRLFYRKAQTINANNVAIVKNIMRLEIKIPTADSVHFNFKSH